MTRSCVRGDIRGWRSMPTTREASVPSGRVAFDRHRKPRSCPPAMLAAAAVSADLVLVEALATGPDELLVAPSSRAVASVAYCSEVPVWLVVGRGRRLPAALFATMLERVADVRVPWQAIGEPMPLALAGLVVGPDGIVDAMAPDVLVAECGMAHSWCDPVRRGLDSVAACPASVIRSRVAKKFRAYLQTQHTLNVATIGPSGSSAIVAMWYASRSGAMFWTSQEQRS